MFTRLSPVILVFLVFAGIGFILRVIEDPVNILLTAGLFALLIYFVNNYMKTGKFLPRLGKPVANKPTTKTVRTQPKKAASSRKHIPFQVIEGSKGKTKNNNKEKETEPKIYH